MFTNSFCSCGDCDSALVFSPIAANQDCNYETFLSEICGLLLFEDTATLPTDWTVKADWTAVINNSGTDGTEGKYITGIGSIEAPDKITSVAGKGKVMTVTKTYEVQFTVTNISDLHYAFLRQLQCNPTNYRFFIETNGGHILGSSTGIRPSFTDVDFVYPTGKESIETAIIFIRWNASCDPDRTYIANLSSDFTATPSEFEVWGPVEDGDEAYGPVEDGDEVYGPLSS